MDKKHKRYAEQFTEEVQKKEQHKIRARQQQDKTWFWLGMFGLVGWSVAIPSIMGIMLGVWIDKNYPSKHSWTLMCLITGVIVGCFQAWYWIHQESSDV